MQLWQKHLLAASDGICCLYSCPIVHQAEHMTCTAAFSLLACHLVCRAIWDIQLDVNDIIELESSSSAKFSRHVVITLQNAAFANNAVVGLFVSQMLRQPQVDGFHMQCVLECANALLMS